MASLGGERHERDPRVVHQRLTYLASAEHDLAERGRVALLGDRPLQQRVRGERADLII